jgi:putative tryptophan/tyrosine transport system substrate-binding protein
LPLGSVAVWPRASRAQQPEQMRRIGLLFGAAANDPVNQAFYAALLEGLQQLGWTDDRNVHFEVRWAAGNAADTRKYAAELVALAPDVILGVAVTVESFAA